MSIRRALLAAGIGLVVVLQLGIPAVNLLSPRPARFGWQMYSTAQPAPEAWTKSVDGTLEPLSLDGHWAVLRAEIDDVDAFATQVCDLTDAPEVVVRLQPDATETVACA